LVVPRFFPTRRSSDLFSSLGLAVLIFDKRGTGESTGLRMDASTGTVMKPAYYPDDLANDALSALHFLQQRKDIDPERIGLWGSRDRKSTRLNSSHVKI